MGVTSFNGFSFLKKTNEQKLLDRPFIKQILLILFLWVLVVAWRPYYFGFYHDDWASVVSIPHTISLFTIKKFLTTDPTRPLYLFIIYVIGLVCGTSPIRWQFTLAFVQLLCSISIMYASTFLLDRMRESIKEETRWCGAIAGILWFVFPWSLGYSAWPVMLPPDIGVVLSVWGIIVAIKSDEKFWNIVLSVSLFSLSWLIYESTWFIWIPVAMLLFSNGILNKIRLYYALKFFTISLVVQVLFVIGNRSLSTGNPTGKHLSLAILSTLKTDVALLRAELVPSLSVALADWKIYIVFGISALAVGMFGNLKRFKYSFSGFVMLAALLTGLILSAILYAAAGYSIEWTGLFSRTTLSISLYLTIASSILFGMAWINASKSIKILAVTGIMAIFIPLTASLANQSILWHKSWIEQQKILNAIPDHVVDLADATTTILMDVPRGTGPVFTFSAFWDISGAVASRKPSLIGILNETTVPHFLATVLRLGEWRTTWDGKVVRQAWCSSPNSPLWGSEAQHVYIWKYPEKKATPLVAPYDSGCSVHSAGFVGD